MPELVITGGRVIDPESGFDATADVLIVDGVVREIQDRPGRVSTADRSDAESIDAEGLIVAPGLIDFHVHFREPSRSHRETIATGSSSAINGGFTSVCCMPNTDPPIDCPEVVNLIHTREKAAHGAKVFTSGCLSRNRAGRELADISAMARAGAIAFTDDGRALADTELMRQALTAVKSVDSCLMQHCQDPDMTPGSVMNAGSLATKLGLQGWPVEAEETIIQRDIDLNRDIGCRYHVQHVSSAGSVELIRRAQRTGQSVTTEAAPHHLLLTENLCDGYNTLAKVNPPLRTRHDVDALKMGIADGTITVLATDHAPHPVESKLTDFGSASFGMVGLDCALPLYIKALIIDGVLDWPQMLAMMTINPARLVSIDRLGLGKLTVDGPADITILDPQHQWTIHTSDFASVGRNCPYEGLAVTGRAGTTIVAGQVKMNRLPPARLTPYVRIPRSSVA